jgi:hypothetical protein
VPLLIAVLGQRYALHFATAFHVEETQLDFFGVL